MKIIIDITPEEVLSLIAVQDEVGRNKIIHSLEALATMKPCMTPEGREAFERDFDRDGAEIFGSALRGSMPATEPSPEDWHNQLQQ